MGSYAKKCDLISLRDCRGKTKKPSRLGRLFQTLELYLGWESNPHERYGSRDFKSRVSTSSTTQAS